LKNDNGKINPPIESAYDKIDRIVRSGFLIIPGVGSTAGEIFNSIITPPIELRKQEWMKEVSNALNALYEKKLIDLAELQSNEEFITILIQASSVALKSHQKEKIEALINAIKHSISPEPPPFSLQTVFISIIDKMSEWHFRFLFFFESLNGAACMDMSEEDGFENWLESWFGDLEGYRDIYKFILQDLQSMGLIPEQPYKHGDSLAFGNVTDIGRQFVNYIKKKG